MRQWISIIRLFQKNIRSKIVFIMRCIISVSPSISSFCCSVLFCFSSLNFCFLFFLALLLLKPEQAHHNTWHHDMTQIKFYRNDMTSYRPWFVIQVTSCRPWLVILDDKLYTGTGNIKYRIIDRDSWHSLTSYRPGLLIYIRWRIIDRVSWYKLTSYRPASWY